MHRSHPRRAVALATAAAAAAGLALFAAPAGAAPAGTVTITNTLPNWLARGHQNAVTPFAAAPQAVRVYLNPNGGLAALKAKVAALSDPASPDYRHWLTTAQYAASYAPTAASATAVSSYLASQGLTVTGVEAHNRYVAARGSTAALDAAFHVTLGSWTHDGQTVTAPSTAAALPAAVAADVLTITGLDTTQNPLTHDTATPDAAPPPGFVNGRPCAIDYGNPLATYKADGTTPLPQFKGQTLSYAPCGYTGPQFRAAYEGNSSLYGAGVTVAVIDAYAWQRIAYDTNTYAINHGDGRYAPGQLTQSTPSSFTYQKLCGPSGWATEETLDVEATHAMAPAANIRYYAAASCLDSDLTDAAARVVDDDVAQVVTNSYGDAGERGISAATIAAFQQVVLQGATQGQSFLFSSGDSGDELAATGIKQADWPATDPYVTAVGGTSTGIANGAVVTQTGWGTVNWALAPNGSHWYRTGEFLYGAGGGYSALFNRPSYQNGKVPSSAPPGRAVPDVAMDADPNTGMLLGISQTFPDGVHYGEYRIGGTSLASPLLAGFMALAVQNSGSGFGALNPLLYSTPRRNITDVTPVSDLGVVRVNNNNGIDPTNGVSYFVRTFNQDSSLATAVGWDPVTGLGVPNPNFLAAVGPAK